MIEKKSKYKTNDYEENFIAPDGGWGWLVCLAAGIANFCIFPGVQVFGLIYRDKLLSLNFTNSQITTIMNSQNAMASGSGLFNGPLFRILTFRQVGLFGALFISVGLFLSGFADTFVMYITCYSLIFGFGSGIMVSANSLAINTYFKEKRRRAASFTWTITGLGPLIFPYIVTIILPILGFKGTVWLFSGLSMHAFACALIYQPVEWHTEMINSNKISSNELIADDSVNSSYLHKTNVSSREKTTKTNDNLKVSKTFFNHGLSNKTSINEERSKEHVVNDTNLENIMCSHENVQKKDEISELDSQNLKKKKDEQTLKLYEKIILFFDLSLLKDLTFVNLMVGMTLSTFADFNFTVLMPFFLADFGYSKEEIAILMSLIGGSDILMRFLVPFLVEDIKWDNRIFFVIAVCGMTLGRIVLAHKPPYEYSTVLFVWIGAFKGLRTIFLALIIPSHVPLKRLPAASGLQLLTSGVFTFLCGPIVGIIRDSTNYTLTLHFLNLISLITVFSWSIELMYHSYRKKKIKEELKS